MAGLLNTCSLRKVDVVDAGIGAGVGEHHEAVTDEDSSNESWFRAILKNLSSLL
jgi:hypothetical protein